MNKIFSLVLLTAASSWAATVAEMSGTVFTPEQFTSHPQSGIPAPVAVAIAAGMVALFAVLQRKSRKA